MAATPRHNPWLYPAIEARRLTSRLTFKTMAAGMEAQKAMTQMAAFFGFVPRPQAKFAHDFLSASCEMSDRLSRDYPKPAFGLAATAIDGQVVRVTEETVSDKAFGSLLH